MAEEQTGNESGRADSDTREMAERALRGEHNPAIPPSDNLEGTHARSHAAHLEPEEQIRTETEPQGSARAETILVPRRQP